MGILLSNRGAQKKSNLFYALFSSMMVFSITIWIVTSMIFGQKMWLLDTNFPGGPDAYWEKNISVWYMAWSLSAAILLQLMTDGLMVGHTRGVRMCAHLIGSRFTAVGLYGIVIASLSYPLFCGCLPLVSNAHTTPLRLLHSMSPSLGSPGRLDQ